VIGMSGCDNLPPLFFALTSVCLRVLFRARVQERFFVPGCAFALPHKLSIPWFNRQLLVSIDLIVALPVLRVHLVGWAWAVAASQFHFSLSLP